MYDDLKKKKKKIKEELNTNNTLNISFKFEDDDETVKTKNEKDDESEKEKPLFSELSTICKLFFLGKPIGKSDLAKLTLEETLIFMSFISRKYNIEFSEIELSDEFLSKVYKSKSTKRDSLKIDHIFKSLIKWIKKYFENRLYIFKIEKKHDKSCLDISKDLDKYFIEYYFMKKIDLNPGKPTFNIKDFSTKKQQEQFLYHVDRSKDFKKLVKTFMGINKKGKKQIIHYSKDEIKEKIEKKIKSYKKFYSSNYLYSPKEVLIMQIMSDIKFNPKSKLPWTINDEIEAVNLTISFLKKKLSEI
jgi:hypothetical protein